MKGVGMRVTQASIFYPASFPGLFPYLQGEKPWERGCCGQLQTKWSKVSTEKAWRSTFKSQLNQALTSSLKIRSPYPTKLGSAKTDILGTALPFVLKSGSSP